MEKALLRIWKTLGFGQEFLVYQDILSEERYIMEEKSYDLVYE